MSNLLDKASIILTPTAYNNGEALCVKPSDGSGDFDFSRNSAATRVNAQGLVENAQILSSNLVQNGDFSDGTTGWSNPTYSGNNSASLSIDNGALKIEKNADFDWRSSFVSQTPITYVSGKTYKITYSLKDGTTSGADVYIRTNFDRSANTVNVKALTNDWVEYTDYYVADTSADDISFGVLAWQNTGSGQYYFIDNVSIIEITTDTSLPRINYEGFSYDGSGNVVPDSGCGSWLFEPQTTQLLPYSEDFSQWIAGGDTTIESGYLAPDGTNNAYKVSGTSNALVLGASLLTTTTRSIYARTVSGTGQAHLCSFNGNSNNLFTITEQWQRFEVNSATTTGVVNFYAVDFRNQTNLSEIILWGANATNDQDYATSYIPSNGSTVTRNQDVCTNGGSLASINSTEGVFYAEIAALANDGTNRVISISDGTTSQRISIVLGTLSNQIRGQVLSSGTSFDFSTTSYNTLNNNKIAISYKLNDFSMWINGTKVSTDTSGNTPVGMNTISFNAGTTTLNYFGKTKALAVWKEALSDEELTELTTI